MTAPTPAPYRGGLPLAEVVRSGFVESRHHGSVVVLDAHGAPAAVVGDAQAPVFPRSSNKPMQAVGMLDSGLALADPADLAVVCASHWGEEQHTGRVRALLHRAGLDESDLACPVSLPLSEPARDALLAAGGGPTRVHMNCSGKHAGMLLTCRQAGWPTQDYLAPGHPLQRALADTVAALCGEPVAATGVDGCGAPLFAVSLTGLARAFLALVTAPADAAAGQVAAAMRAHPELVAGTGADALDTRLMRAVPGLLAKSGAEGVAAVAVPGLGAVAFKTDDGAARARGPVVVAALRLLGVDMGGELAGWAEPPVYGGGVPVGSVRCVAPLAAERHE